MARIRFDKQIVEINVLITSLEPGTSWATRDDR